MMVVPIYSGDSFSVGIPKKLFRGNFFPPIGATVLNERSYDVSADGQRFLMIKDAPDEAAGFVVVQNWDQELKRLVPTR